MPPRYAYWTILVDNLPTAFRATSREDLQPTFEQLRRKNPTAVMRWFARGTLWDSPEHAGRAAREEGERRAKGWRPGGDHRDPRERFELERKARNAARRQDRFDQKVQRRRPDDADTRPPEGRARDARDRPQGKPPAERPSDNRGRFERPGPRGARPFDNRDRLQGRGPRDDRPLDARDRAQGRPPGGRPEGRPFDNRGRPDRPDPRGTRPFDNRDRPQGRGPRDNRPTDDGSRGTGERPHGYRPREQRPFDSRGPARPPGPRDDRRPHENRERRPDGRGPQGSHEPRPAWKDRDRRPPADSREGDRSRPRERAERFGPRDGDDRPRRDRPGGTGRAERGGAGRPECPRTAPGGERRGNTPRRPEGPPPGPDRPPRPGQEPPPVPGRSEDIVIPPEPPERGRGIDGPAGSRLIRRPRGDRR